MPGERVPRIEIPDTDIWTYLFERKEKPFSDDQPIYTCALTGRSYNYATTKQTAIAFGTGLRTHFSFRKGQVLAVFSSNCIDSPAITWGTHWAGGIVSPANPAYTIDELAIHLGDCDAKILVTQAKLLDVARAAAAKVGLPEERILLIEQEKGVGPRAVGKCRHFTQVLDQSGKGARERLDCKKDLSFLVYSSGTTGKPKGVMLSHLNTVSNIAMLAAVEGKSMTSGTDRIIAVLPYYHIYGLTCLIHQPLHIGVETFVMPSFDLPVFLSTIQTHRITYVYVAPPVVVHLAKNPMISDYDLTSIRFMTSGAAPLSKDLIREVHARVGIRIKQAYGLSETSPATHMMYWDETWRTAMGSNGPPLPNIEVKFMNADGAEVGVGQEGEMWISGPTVFQGYHRNQAATDDCMTRDGWFKTGDVGYEDEDGNMYITDRVKELIKYKGSQVAPAELEGILVGHAAVNDCAVVGWHVEAIHTEVPLAFVVVKEGTNRDEALAKEIIAWLGQRTAKTKLLRGGVIFIDEVPKSASGKILRRVLKDQMKKDGFEGGLGRARYDNMAKL